MHLSSFSSLLKFPQQLELGQTKARSQEHISGSLLWGTGTWCLSRVLGHQQKGWIVERDGTGQDPRHSEQDTGTLSGGLTCYITAPVPGLHI